jgi:hypothetical protein
MDSLVCAISNVQQLNLRLKDLDGPHPGHASTMHDFLAQFVAKHQIKTKPTSSLVETADGITVQSALPELGEASLSYHDLQALEPDAGLCHMDMEPRNVLVRRCLLTEQY